MTDPFIEEMRSSYRSMIPLAGSPDPVATVRTFRVPGEGGTEVPVRAYLPTEASAGPCPVIVFVHGGGWVSGDLDTHDVLTRALAVRTPAVVLSVDYRLAPEHPFPAGLTDVMAVIRWAGAHAESLGGDPQRLVVSGDSAGGNIAAASALLARDTGGPAIAAQWLMYPSLSNGSVTPSWTRLGDVYFPTRSVQRRVVRAYVPPDVSVDDPRISPANGDLQGLPPALIQVGELDPLRDECAAYAVALRSAGVPAETHIYPGAQHGFVQFFKDRRSNPAGALAIDAGVAFLRELRPGGTPI